MISDYDKGDEARRLRDARLKQEYEEGVRLEAAKNEGIALGREEGLAQGREEGIAQGREEGLAQGKGIVVKKLFQNGMKKEEIAKLFKLSLEEVEKYIG